MAPIYSFPSILRIAPSFSLSLVLNSEMEDIIYIDGKKGVEEVLHYPSDENGKRKDNKKRASWNEPQRSFLIELLHLFNNPRHRVNIGWTQTAWSGIANRFNEKFPLANYSERQLMAQEQSLKKAYITIKGLIDSGFEWDFNTKRFNFEPICDLYFYYPAAEEWHDKTLYYDELAPLYEGCLAKGSLRKGTNYIAWAKEKCNVYEEQSSRRKRKRKRNGIFSDDYIKMKKNETEKYIQEMRRQDETSRVRAEIERKQFELENKYSLKNAMDLFNRLNGFSFKDYDKVTRLFLMDEKIMKVFIDVKEEYKEPWIWARISTL